MAGRSQHLEQIMENQTRFDLNAAVENWRNELAAQPNLASGDRRELETHLRDAIAGFQQRGLNDEESFWLARRRVGQPQQLGEEFVQADPTKIWRERVFWMAVALLLINIWTDACGFIMKALHDLFPNCLWLHFAPGSNFIFMVLQASPLICFAFLLMNNRVPQSTLKLLSFFQTRRRFILIIVAVFVMEFFGIMNALHSARLNHGFGSTGRLAFGLLLNTTWPLISIVLVAWLMPSQNRKSSKRA
jgi:hypothetical protein